MSHSLESKGYAISIVMIIFFNIDCVIIGRVMDLKSLAEDSVPEVFTLTCNMFGYKLLNRPWCGFR